jgi:hypothetical protein
LPFIYGFGMKKLHYVDSEKWEKWGNMCFRVLPNTASQFFISFTHVICFVRHQSHWIFSLGYAPRFLVSRAGCISLVHDHWSDWLPQASSGTGLGERATGTGLRCPRQRIIRGRSVRKSARQVAMGGAAAIPNIFLVRCPTRQRARVCLRTLRPTLYDFECFVPHQKASSDLYENSLLHVTPNRLDLRHGITTSWVTASVPVSRSRWCQSWVTWMQWCDFCYGFALLPRKSVPRVRDRFTSQARSQPSWWGRTSLIMGVLLSLNFVSIILGSDLDFL